MAAEEQLATVLFVAMMVTYISMFVADALAQAMQRQLDHRDNHLIVQFIWMMQKRTLVSVSRFEEFIHTHFEELVSLGYLKLKT
mmetsp:Transcript_10049/g.14333  ORF Transcript_10049/g.14333 Transcript_10049/m.14333 type:complete len:84 (+) Transcript_10049:220-471(+)